MFLPHAVAGMEDDGGQDDVEEDLGVECRLLLTVEKRYKTLLLVSGQFKQKPTVER
jgi:hypothetical protein